MKKFMMIYHATPAAMKRWKNMKPEDRKKGMAAWQAWKKKCGKKLVTFGNPIGKGAKLAKGSTKPGSKSLCGYSIIKSKDLAAAKKLVRAHPHLAQKACSIEVYEIMPMH